MSKQECLVARGYIDHETSHKRYTDIPTMKRLNTSCNRSKNGLLKSVVNAVEDLRVDYLAIRDLPGSKLNLETTSEAVLKEFLEFANDHPEEAKDMEVSLPVLITAEGRRRMGYRCDSIEPSLSVVDPEDRKKIETYVDLAIQSRDPDQVRGTEESIAIGKAIIESKKEQDEQEKNEGAKDQGQGNGNGSDGDGDGGGSQQPQVGDGDESGSNDGDDAGGGGGDENNPQESGAGGNPDYQDTNQSRLGSQSQAPASDEEKDFTQRAMNKNFSAYTESSDDRYRPYSTEKDGIWKMGDGSPIDTEFFQKQTSCFRSGVDRYEEIVHQMHGKITTMSRKLERALLSKQRRDWQINREDGSLDPKRLVQASMGKPNVFRIREDRPETDTAACMLIDLSGSMSGGRVQLAQQVAIAMGMVMEKVGVTFEVMGWNNYCEGFGDLRPGGMGPPLFSPSWIREMEKAKGDSTQMYSRYQALQMYEFKAFDRRLVQERESMGLISHCAGGVNSDAEAVRIAGRRVAVRNESRKILFVLSDGLPNAACDFGRQHQGQHLRNRIGELGNKGVECIGIGINSDAVSRFYPQYVVVKDLEDLPKAAFDQMAKLLLGERFVVDNSELLARTSLK